MIRRIIRGEKFIPVELENASIPGFKLHYPAGYGWNVPLIYPLNNISLLRLTQSVTNTAFCCSISPPTCVKASIGSPGWAKTSCSAVPEAEMYSSLSIRGIDKIELLHWSGGCFILYYKRLKKGTFELPGCGTKNGYVRLDYARLVMDGQSIKNIRHG